MNKTLFVAMMLFAYVMIASACTPVATAPSVLADKALVADTDIYLGSDQYFIQEREDLPQAAKKKPKVVEPVDVDYILTKSRDVSVGVSTDVSETKSGVRAQKEDVSFVPASATKIITTAVALRQLGADFRFKTRVGFDLSPSGEATNVIVSADGDPTAGIPTAPAGAPFRLQEIVQGLKARGVRSVSGEIRLVSTDTRLDVATFAEGIPLEDMRECYGALAMAFNYQANCAPVHVNAQTGFAWLNPGAADAISTSVETTGGDKSRSKIEAVLSGDRGLRGYRLTGTYAPQTAKVAQLRLPIGNATNWYGQSLLAALGDASVQTDRVLVKVVSSARDHASTLSELSRRQSVLTIESAPLSTLVEAANKPSDNFFADAIFKSAGVRSGSLDTRLVSASRAMMKDAVSDWLRGDGHGAWAGDFEFHEGAGLSTSNRATPRAFLSVLRRLTFEPTFPALWQSLPIAGVDGTLADRMKNTSAAGRVRAKTGTLKGSYQLVGYIPRGQGRATEYIPFVILTSTTEKNRDLVRRFQDAVVVKMVESINAVSN